MKEAKEVHDTLAYSSGTPEFSRVGGHKPVERREVVPSTVVPSEKGVPTLPK